MAVLRSIVALAALAALPACYSPDLRDCTVTCETAADCVGGQVCGADHLCAAPAVAGACSHLGADGGLAGDVDAPPPRDARPPHDAPPPPDGPKLVMLHLHVDGHGALVAGAFTCTTDCADQVPVGVPIDVAANPAPGQMLERWTAGPCNGATNPTCTVTPLADVLVAVKFVKMDH